MSLVRADLSGTGACQVGILVKVLMEHMYEIKDTLFLKN